MSRDIRFRAWDGSRMLSFDIKSLASQCDSDDIVSNVVDEHGGFGASPIEECQIMQFTGFKGQNGRDLYEGDVIVADSYPFFNEGEHNYSAVIEWEYGAWYYDIFPVSDRAAGRACGSQLYELVEGGNVRVIGNIYENPELVSPRTNET